MTRRPPESTRTDTLFPYTTLFRSYIMLKQMLLIGAAAVSFPALAQTTPPASDPMNPPTTTEPVTQAPEPAPTPDTTSPDPAPDTTPTAKTSPAPTPD